MKIQCFRALGAGRTDRQTDGLPELLDGNKKSFQLKGYERPLAPMFYRVQWERVGLAMAPSEAVARYHVVLSCDTLFLSIL